MNSPLGYPMVLFSLLLLALERMFPTLSSRRGYAAYVTWLVVFGIIIVGVILVVVVLVVPTAPTHTVTSK